MKYLFQELFLEAKNIREMHRILGGFTTVVPIFVIINNCRVSKWTQNVRSSTKIRKTLLSLVGIRVRRKNSNSLKLISKLFKLNYFWKFQALNLRNYVHQTSNYQNDCNNQQIDCNRMDCHRFGVHQTSNYENDYISRKLIANCNMFKLEYME